MEELLADEAYETWHTALTPEMLRASGLQIKGRNSAK